MEYIWKQLAIIIMFAVVVNLCFVFCLFLFLDVMQQREKSWFSSSLRSRMQYLGPDLGLPSINEELPKNISLDPSVVQWVHFICWFLIQKRFFHHVNV